MAKRGVSRKSATKMPTKPSPNEKRDKQTPREHLTISLFAPGMTAFHRAGLGGLACTLKAIERHYENGQLTKSRLPAPYVDGQPPWEIHEDSVTLHFGESEHAGEYLKKLYEFGFQIQNQGLILLPGQSISELPTPVLADLQTGLTLTFLQHGKARQLDEETHKTSYNPEGNDAPGIEVQFRKCAGYKHQNAWKELVDRKGALKSADLKVDGCISPGSVVRHVAFSSDTSGEETVERMLCLHFALVGCVALPVNRGVAVLLVPAVENLEDFLYDRPEMTPSTSRTCQIANAADAALQAQLRLRSSARRSTATALQALNETGKHNIPGCYAMTFRPTPWASQQKSRVATLSVHSIDEKVLDRFDRVLGHLPQRIVVRTSSQTIGKGRQKNTIEHRESFRADSVARPLIAQNLVNARPWYAGFVELMTKTNPATEKPYRFQLSFERKGLHAMISDPVMWDQEGEALIVRAVHEAIRQSFGRIREETDGEKSKKVSVATKNRWERFREKLRLDLAGAKTAAQLRFALTDLFSRGGNNAILREGWAKVLPVIRGDWQLARDLGLLALASYAGRERDDEDADSNN